MTFVYGAKDSGTVLEIKSLEILLKFTFHQIKRKNLKVYKKLRKLLNRNCLEHQLK